MTFPARTLPEAAAAAGDPIAALALAQELGARLPLPGRGETAALWSALAGLGATDLTVARSVEPHLDALAILDQAGERRPRLRSVSTAPAPGASSRPRVRACGWRRRTTDRRRAGR